MANTLEKWRVAWQAGQILSNTRRDLRRNAQQYKDWIASNKWTLQFSVTPIVSQAEIVLKNLKMISDHKVLVEEALLDLGIDTAAVRAEFLALRSAALHERDDILPDGSNVITVLDDILASVTSQRLLF